MKQFTAIIAAIILSLTFSACSSDDSGTQPFGDSGVGSALVSVTASAPLRAAGSDGDADGITTLAYNSPESSFTYSYDAVTGALRVRHSGAALRSAADGTAAPLTLRVRIEENIITVIERQHALENGPLALYDIDFEITNLPVRAYRVVVIEPYVDKDQAPLSFRMDLVESLEGGFTAERNQAPWGDIATL